MRQFVSRFFTTAISPSLFKKEQCPLCKGRGAYNDGECRVCRGVGTVDAKDLPDVDLSDFL